MLAEMILLEPEPGAEDSVSTGETSFDSFMEWRLSRSGWSVRDQRGPVLPALRSGTEAMVPCSQN